MYKKLLFLMLSCVFLLTGCGSKEKKHHLDPAALVGMTKDEVLTQAFAKCSKTTTGGLYIYVQEINCFAGHEFNTLPGHLGTGRNKGIKVIVSFFRKRTSCPALHRRTCRGGGNSAYI